jgi:hypothetical protein
LQYANFTLPPEDPRSDEVKEVHGSFVNAMYLLILAGDTTVTVEYDAARPHTARVQATTAGRAGPPVAVSITTEHGPLTFGGVATELRSARPVELVVTTPDWRAISKPGVFRAAADGARMARIDVGIVALADPLEAAVAPHGLLGQGFDGLRIDGKTDDYVPDAHGVFVTTAQGEGAIEGTIADYEVSGPFATEFRFGRLGKARAPPRDVTKLNAPVGATRRSMKGASADTEEADPPGMEGRRLAAGCPTTQAPTTMAPTTSSPTTAAPTTMAPTTSSPTTAAPTTMAPTTSAPTTAPFVCPVSTCINDTNRDAAVQLWFEDQSTAEATFGDITAWVTSQLTNGDNFLQRWVVTFALPDGDGEGDGYSYFDQASPDPIPSCCEFDPEDPECECPDAQIVVGNSPPNEVFAVDPPWGKTRWKLFNADLNAWE